MLMRVAVFPREEHVSEVPAEVVRDQLLATLKDIPGFAKAYFCVDPVSGKGLSVTLWETSEALEASESSIGGVARSASHRIPDPVSVETFEVTYTA